MITRTERETYDEVWTSVDRYSAPDTIHPGLEFLPILLDLVGDERGTLLDAGCGSGEAGLAYRSHGFTVTLTDITEAGLTEEARTLPFFQASLWEPLTKHARVGGAYDLVTCTDVLEHLPTQFTMLAASRLLEVGRRVFLSVAHQPDVMGYWVGRPLHLSVFPFTWWRDSFKELGTVLEARDLLTTGIFYLEAR